MKYKRVISIILAALFAGLMLSACSGGEVKKEQIDLKSVKEEIITKLDIKDAKDIETDKLSDLYGIEADDVASSACFITMGGTFPEEAVMIEAANGEALERIKKCLEGRLEDVLVQSRNYDAENYALAQTCRVETQGSFISLFVSAKHADMEKIFEDAVK